MFASENVLEYNAHNYSEYVYDIGQHLTSTVLSKGNTETTSCETQQQTKIVTLHDQSKSHFCMYKDILHMQLRSAWEDTWLL